MSGATLETNWLDQFKLKIKCGSPAFGPNAENEIANGMVALKVEELLAEFPTALYGDTNQPSIQSSYDKIVCGELYQHPSELNAILARVLIARTAALNA